MYTKIIRLAILAGQLIVFLTVGFTSVKVTAAPRGISRAVTFQKNLPTVPGTGNILSTSRPPPGAGSVHAGLGEPFSYTGVDEDISGYKRKVYDKLHERRILKRVKRGEDEDEGWGDGQQFGGKLSAVGGRSDSKEDSQENINNGMAPVKGPYDKLTSRANNSIRDDDVSEGAPISGQLATKLSFTNWDEYKQNQRRAAKNAASTRQLKNRPGEETGQGLVMHPDDHFRYVDKLFKDKNDRVKAFHALVLFMKEQGKDFKIPQKPTVKPDKNSTISRGPKS